MDRTIYQAVSFDFRNEIADVHSFDDARAAMLFARAEWDFHRVPYYVRRVQTWFNGQHETYGPWISPWNLFTLTEQVT